MSFSKEEEKLIRSEFKELTSLYFNSAYFGPSPFRAKERVENVLKKEFNPSFFAYKDWYRKHEKSRAQFANLLNTDPNSIFHSTSTSDIISMISNSLSLKSSDEVLLVNNDYPSNILPWKLKSKNGGCSLNVKNTTYPNLDWFKTVVTNKTKVVNLSHVSFNTGSKIDLLNLGPFFKERNITFIVDSTQSIGGLFISPEELQYIDVLSCSTYKWILGPYGHAFGYIASEILPSLKQVTGNWLAHSSSENVYSLLEYDKDYLPGARIFDRGQTPNMMTLSMLESSLEFLLELGPKKIENYNRKNVHYFLENFPKKKYEIMTEGNDYGNIIALRSKFSSVKELEDILNKKKIDVSIREGKLRISFHLFNTEAQIEELIRALDF